jgi:hypothetical protein
METRLNKKTTKITLRMIILIVLGALPTFLEAQLYSRHGENASAGEQVPKIAPEPVAEGGGIYSKKLLRAEDYSGYQCELCGSPLNADGSCSNPSCDRGIALAQDVDIETTPIGNGLWILLFFSILYMGGKKKFNQES